MTELVRAAQAGDAEAFIRLIDMNRSCLLKVAGSILREQMDIEDAVSETVLSCYEHIGELRRAEYFKTWLIRILINKCRDIIKSRRGVVPLDEEIIESTPDDRPFAEGDGFDALLELLPPPCRPVLTLYYSEGYRLREISRILGIPQGTAASRLRRGRAQLASILGKEGKQ